jgi:hypothetical protein
MAWVGDVRKQVPAGSSNSTGASRFRRDDPFDIVADQRSDQLLELDIVQLLEVAK